MKTFLRSLALVLSVLCLTAFCVVSMTGCAKKQLTLRVYNWGDYIDPDVLEAFKKANPDITVQYDTYDSNEAMLAKLDGGAQYDILFPSDYMVEKLIAENRLTKLDLSKIPNFKNIDSRFVGMAFDKTNAYSVPYMWGTLGILYNTNKVDVDVDSWGILFGKAYKGQVIMYDSVRDSMAVALKYLGYSVNDRDQAHLDQAKALLKKQKSDGIVKAYMTDTVKETMISNSASLAVVYSGDANLCIADNPDLAYVVPKEGSNVWCDNVVVSKNCQSMDAAYRFINYLCDGQAAAKNSEYIGYSSPNKAAVAILGADYTDNPVNTPSAEALAKCEVYLDLGDYTAIYNKIWEDIKLQ